MQKLKMPWDEIVTDFGGEETINFGPRQESGSALYQIETLATISSRDQGQYIPCTQVTVLGDLACIAVQEHLFIFKDSHQTASIELGGVIDCIEWSPDGSMLMVGDCTGKLSLLDTDSADILFSFTVVPQGSIGKAFKRILFGSKMDGTMDLVIVADNGQMIVLQGVNLDLFSADEGKIATSIREKLLQTRADQFHTKGVNDVVCFDDKIVTLGCGDIALGIWVVEDGQLVLEDEISSSVFNGAGLLEGRISTDGKHLFVLTDSNIMVLLNTTTMVAIKAWPDMRVSQFQLLETKDIQNQSLQNMKLVLLTKGEANKTNLMVQSLPTCETVYNLQLHQPSALANCKTFQETLFLAECSPSSGNQQQYSVRLRCLTETNPETRLFRILRKNKFEEAETFAKLYRLDTELVHKVKAHYLLEQMSPWNNNSEDKVTEMSNQFLHCLSFIMDDLHVADICMGAAMSSLEGTQKLLDYSKDRLMKMSTDKSTDTTQKDKQQVLLTKLYEIQHRLLTFKMIQGKENYSAERWDTFMKADLMKLLSSMLTQGQLSKASVLLARHECELEKSLKPEVIHTFLQYIPDNVKAGEILCVMTETIIPTVSRLIPHVLIDVVQWIMQKAKSLELLDKKSWPVNALQFLRSVYGVLVREVDISYSNSIFTAADISMKTQIERVDVLEGMRTLITNLQHLYDLETKYNCKLSFGNFLQETTESVTFRMLDKVVAIEMINQALEKQIRPYMREHNLREDIIFSKYIKDLLERSGRMTSYLGEAVWETKVIAIIGCISSPQYKCGAILEAMKSAPIPWSKGIQHLVEGGLKLDHDLVVDIQKQVHLMEVKKLMFKYNLKKTDIPSYENSEMLMYYILSQNCTDSIDDAISVMKGYDPKVKNDLYVFRMRHLIKYGKVDDCIALLKSLPLTEKLACGRKITQFISVLLNDPSEFNAQETNRKKRLHVEAGCSIIKYVMEYFEDFSELSELKELLLVFQNMLALQTEYDQYITLDQYHNEAVRTNLLISYAKQFFIKRGNNKKETNYTKVYRLADVLQISYVKIQGQLAIEAAKTGGIQVALKHCSKLLESDRTEETAETLYNVAMAFLKLQADAENCDLTAGQLRSLPEVTYMLASEALAICNGHSDIFMKCLELSKVTSLALTVSQQCEAGEYSLYEQEEAPEEKITPSTEMVSDWMADSMFKEDALVMNSTIILPLISQYCVSHPKIADKLYDEIESVSIMRQAVLPVLQYLKDNSHLQLAYQTLLHMLFTVYQTVQQQNMSGDIVRQKFDVEEIERMSAPIVKELLTGVLMKIFSSTYTDHQLALAYVLSGSKRDGQEAVLRIIKSSGHNYRRLRAISYVGIGAGEIHKDANIINMCQKIEVNAKWGNRLSKIKISFKDAFHMPQSEKIKILPQIAQAEGADTELIIDFCKAFQINSDDGLMQYLEHVFSSSSDQSITDPEAKKIQLKKAKAAIDKIKDKDVLLEKLRNLFVKTDSYDYEKLEFLINEMQRIYETPDGEKYAKVLFYLKKYKRRTPPSEFEINYRHQKDKEEMKMITDSLSPLSNTRIPLHPLLDGSSAWKIIGPELRKDTVAIWLPVALSLKMSADQLYVVTIQNMVNSYVSTAKEPATVKSQWNWQKKDANRELLTSVKSLLGNVSNCEMAMACSKWMVTQLPSGAEKVMGLEGCIMLAKKWYQALPENKPVEKEKAMAAVVKFNAMWRRLATEQILFLHGIQKPELHKLACTPIKLIYALYEHPCIVETTEDVDVPVDIHTIVEEVARLNEIDLQQTMLSLMQKWLPSSSSKQQDADSTMTFNFDSLKLGNETMNVADDEDDKNLKRVMYLLRKGDRKTNLVYLLNFAFKDDQTQEMVAITNMCRLRALHCVLELDEEKLLKEQLLQDLCGNTFDDIRNLMKTFTYLVELEDLHILHSVETFQESNKEGLIKGIWRNHYHQKSAALLVARMCIDFKVHEKQLWNGVIQQIMSFGLQENLEYILLRLNSVPDVWQIAVYPKAWQNVIVTPLTKVVAPLSIEHLEMCIHSFNLLKRCPVLQALDMTVFTQHFLRLEMDVCALSCLLLSGEEEAIQNVIARENVKLLETTEKYLTYGMDSFSAQQVKDHVYAYALNNEQFSMIGETSFLPEFNVYAVKNRNISGLIRFAMEKNRKTDADTVLQLFISENRDYLNRLLKISSGEASSEFCLLKAYLELEGMTDLLYILD